MPESVFPAPTPLTGRPERALPPLPSPHLPDLTPNPVLSVQVQKDYYTDLFEGPTVDSIAILSPQQIQKYRDTRNPPQQQTSFSRFKLKFKIATGRDNFECNIQESQKLFDQIKNGEKLKSLPRFLTLNEDGQSPLHLACGYRDEHAVELLLSRMTAEQICLQDKAGKTALHEAAFYGNPKIVKALLAKISTQRIGLRDKNRETPLHMAALYGYAEIVASLIPKMTPREIVLRNKQEQTAFQIACLYQDKRILKIFEISKPLIDPNRTLDDEDVRMAGELLRSNQTTQRPQEAFHILIRSNYWTQKQITRILRNIYLLEAVS